LCYYLTYNATVYYIAGVDGAIVLKKGHSYLHTYSRGSLEVDQRCIGLIFYPFPNYYWYS